MIITKNDFFYNLINRMKEREGKVIIELVGVNIVGMVFRHL